MSAPEEVVASSSPVEAAPPRPLVPPYLRGARAAFVFLTRIPVGGFPYARADFHWAPGYFPLVGLVIGSLGSAVLAAARTLGFGPWVAATLAVTATVFCTGAFHEDGLADTADAFGGSHGGKRALEILKDSRIGAFGALSLVLSQVLRIATVAEFFAADVAAELVFFAFPLSHVLGRTGPVWLMAFLPYVTGPEAKGATVAEGPKTKPALLATLLGASGTALAVFFGLELTHALAALLATAMTALFLGRWYRRKLGGLAGDLLGAQEQVTEIAVLLAILASARLGGA